MHQLNVKILIFVFLISLTALFFFDPAQKGHYVWGKKPLPLPPPVLAPPVTKPATPVIKNPVPSFQEYPTLVAQLEEWNQEAPDLIETGVYGKTAKGVDIHFIRLTNEFITTKRPVVLVTACLHGNEPHSTSTLMACFGTLLSQYGQDERVTRLLDEREIYFVPVASPDSYSRSRQVNGVDPNRDFPGPHDPGRVSVPPVKALQDFFLKIKPQAVISGHTYGRMFLIPHGDRNSLCPDHDQFQQVMRRVGQLCNYRLIRTCELYGRPIRGTEVDWYYQYRAFAVVMEIGTHQRKPTDSEIQSEMKRVYQGVLLFIEEAPRVALNGPNPFPMQTTWPKQRLFRWRLATNGNIRNAL